VAAYFGALLARRKKSRQTIQWSHFNHSARGGH
jgi:hypothetical protein